MVEPTMRDVARRAGVGVGTVSRVVNGSASVSAQTADRVRAAIAELGFRRNELARALRPGRTSRTVALLVGDLTNPFYASAAKAAVEAARAAGYAAVLTMVDEDPAAEEQAVHDLLGRLVAGLVVVPDEGDHAFLRRAQEAGTPVVLLDRPASGVTTDVVLADDAGGGRTATRHLLGHGHERIAVLVAPSYYTTEQRVLGYRRALREAGVAVDESLVVGLEHGTADDAASATERLLRSPAPPTAVFATTGIVCEGVVRAAGSTLALVGFDDLRCADLLPVPTTVVSVDAAEMGRQATRLLLERLGGVAVAPRRLVLPARLTVRGSGEVPPRVPPAQSAARGPGMPVSSARTSDSR